MCARCPGALYWHPSQGAMWNCIMSAIPSTISAALSTSLSLLASSSTFLMASHRQLRNCVSICDSRGFSPACGKFNSTASTHRRIVSLLGEKLLSGIELPNTFTTTRLKYSGIVAGLLFRFSIFLPHALDYNLNNMQYDRPQRSLRWIVSPVYTSPCLHSVGSPSWPHESVDERDVQVTQVYANKTNVNRKQQKLVHKSPAGHANETNAHR